MTAGPFAVPTNRQVAASLLSLLLFPASTILFAQQTPPAAPPASSQPPASTQPPAAATQPATQPAAEPPPPPFPPPGAKLTPNQLDGLVAPIALYPDPLISQILVAATYPREITQAVQWVNQHPDLKGKELTDAAQQQSWDPSIRSLVMFPSVLRRLNQDRVWTTNLGDAFLAQQADVMQAVQRMRRTAKDAGKLSTNRRMKVVETTDSGETAIEIEPAAPDVIYVPSYDPAWIWGPPLWYPYPRWFWGPRPAAGVWFGFGPAIAVGAYYGPGWGGWGYWGWHPGWFNRTIVVNNTFINNTGVSNVSNVSNTSNVTNTAVATNPSTTNPGAASPAATSPATASPATASTSSALASKANVSNTTPTSAAAGSTNAGTANPGGANASANAASANAGKASPGASNAGASNANASKASAPSAAARTTPQTSTWTHDPSHRQGVPYANADVAQRFHAPPPAGQRGGARSSAASGRPAGGGPRGNAPLARARGGAPHGGAPKGGGGRR